MKRSLTFLAIVFALSLPLASSADAKRPSKKQVKINTYVTLLNQWSSYMRKSQSSYLKWVDAKVGPTCKERGIRPPGGLGSSAQETFAGLGKIIKKGPKLSADAEALAMVQALEEFREPIMAAGEYYRSEYRKDDCKKGKKLHPKLMAAWGKYFSNEAAVRKFVVEYNDQRAGEELAKTKKKYGTKIRYHFQKLIMDGKVLIRVVDAQLGVAKPDLAAMQSALDAFRATQAAAKALYDKERAKKKSKIATVLYQGNYGQYCDFAGNFADDVERLIKVLAAGVKDRNAESKLKRDSKNAFNSYNRMVDKGNTVGFTKQVK